MLKITVPETELFNEKTSEIVYTKEQSIQLEHSLISISKWESKWHKPFLDKKEKTQEEILDYIMCMCITPNVSINTIRCLSRKNIEEIEAYIKDTMTATTFSNRTNQPPSREIITSELIYYWMIAFQIPVEFEKWHINRLLTLIKICSIKNAPNKKMSKREIMNRNTSLNAMRRQTMGTKG